MEDFLSELAEYLEQQGIGTRAVDIFVNKQPPDPDDCVTLLGIPGTTLTASRDVPEMQFPRFQVLVRAGGDDGYDNASAKFQDVRAALHGKIGLMLAHWRILRLHAEQEGGPLGEDDQGRAEFSCNIIGQAHYVASP